MMMLYISVLSLVLSVISLCFSLSALVRISEVSRMHQITLLRLDHMFHEVLDENCTLCAMDYEFEGRPLPRA